MATYHGLIKMTCLVCEFATTDEYLITMTNDLTGDCPECQNRFFRWENKDGSIVVSLMDDENNYDNLVYGGNK